VSRDIQSPPAKETFAKRITEGQPPKQNPAPVSGATKLRGKKKEKAIHSIKYASAERSAGKSQHTAQGRKSKGRKKTVSHLCHLANN